MHRYIHTLKTGSLEEVEQVISEFESCGWDFVELLPDSNDCFPKEAVFNWPHEGFPHYPLYL